MGAKVLHAASDASVAAGKAVTVLTYLHGVKEANMVIEEIQAEGMDVDLLEMRSLKPLDIPAIRASLERTHKLTILDESTHSNRRGAAVCVCVWGHTENYACMSDVACTVISLISRGARSLNCNCNCRTA